MKYHNLATPNQRQKASPDQVENNAGGFVFQLEPLAQLDRFLILGSDKPTYYASAKDLSVENAQIVKECWMSHPVETAARIMLARDRAPKLDPCLFALALGFCSDEEKARSAAEAAFPDVVKTASNLFSFMKAVLSMRGTGRRLKRTIASWYLSRTPNQLAYQMVKYRERQGYDHRRALELSHPRIVFDKHGPAKGALFRTVRGRDSGKELEVTTELPEIYRAFHAVQQAQATPKQIAKIVAEHNLPWEAIPTDKVRHPDVQRALIPGMPINAFVRQLGLMSKLGVLEKGDMAKLRNDEAVRKSRIHPYNVLTALATYKSGRGMRTEWPVHGWVLAELNDLFYKAFKNVEPTNKKHLLALDVSGSMSWENIQGGPLDAREASAAMAMITLAVEPDCDVVGFSQSLQPIPLRRRMSLEEVINTIAQIPMGGTDCAQPMLYAMAHKKDYDAFVVYTDSETWAGREHPSEALKRYRKRHVEDAALIVVGMTSSGFTIADPKDPRMLDVVGFDSAAPKLMADFIR